MQLLSLLRGAIRNAYEVREALEAHAAAVAAERGEERALREIAEAARHCLSAAENGDLDGFRTFDLSFHQDVARASENPRLIQLIDDALMLVMALRRRDVPYADASVACARAHVQIAQAITGRRPEAASSLMRQHVRQVEDLVLASLDDDQANSPVDPAGPVPTVRRVPLQRISPPARPGA